MVLCRCVQNQNLSLKCIPVVNSLRHSRIEATCLQHESKTSQSDGASTDAALVGSTGVLPHWGGGGW